MVGANIDPHYAGYFQPAYPADEIRAGSRVEMTFRRLFSADGIHDYFWKARPVRSGTAHAGGEA